MSLPKGERYPVVTDYHVRLVYLPVEEEEDQIHTVLGEAVRRVVGHDALILDEYGSTAALATWEAWNQPRDDE